MRRRKRQREAATAGGGAAQVNEALNTAQKHFVTSYSYSKACQEARAADLRSGAKTIDGV